MSAAAIHEALQRRGINARQVVVPPKPGYEIEFERVTWIPVARMSDAYLLARLARLRHDRDQITKNLKADLASGKSRGDIWREKAGAARKHRKAEIQEVIMECYRRRLPFAKE